MGVGGARVTVTAGGALGGTRVAVGETAAVPVMRPPGAAVPGAALDVAEGVPAALRIFGALAAGRLAAAVKLAAAARLPAVRPRMARRDSRRKTAGREE